ncbi:MAG: bifunctional 5,10-methylenetetrahydrofolate dehydrogenase/5,10-methenyltetrahydrofolate cyclohydrolase [Tissierellia bacterium]|nr:bifunctional 5,10-methylenetetrahydrofolate dehydrogenase/5,10-methenyltetrahydrofolate cyclohydrolase [Tissierellia bacterium]
MNKLDINKLVDELNSELYDKIHDLNNKPGIGLVRVGDDKSSVSYQKSLIKQAEKIGIKVLNFEFDNIYEDILLQELEKINDRSDVNGILIFQPLPKYLNSDKIMNSIDPRKDVDGCSKINQGRLMEIDDYRNLPTTAVSILEYLKSIVDLKGKNVLIINRSSVIGKPLMMLLLKENSTVTVAHSHTVDIYKIMEDKDIIISAVGKANIYAPTKLKEDAIVLDIGLSLGNDGKMSGDFDINSIDKMNIRYMPAIGGIGKLNSNIILKNTYLNYMEEINER